MPSKSIADENQLETTLHLCYTLLMFEIATLTPDGSLQLPVDMVRALTPSVKFLVWQDGDVLHLKPMTADLPSLLDLVAEATEDEYLTLDEINEIVHEVRQQNLLV
jgi:hypothetical protein